MEMTSDTCKSDNNEENDSPESNKLPTKTSIFRQLVAATLANITMMSTGVQYGWPTIALPILEGEDTKDLLHITSSEGAWAVSILSLGACIGPIMSAVMVDRVGRKWTLLSTLIPNIVCWVLVYFATMPEMLYVARFISGLGIGATFSTAPMYLGEIAEKKVRGSLGVILCIMVAIGTVGTYAVGPFVSLPVLSLIVMVPSIVCLCTFIWMPESPYYYLLKDQLKDAEKSLVWLRGTKKVTVELQEMWHLTKLEKEMRGGFMDLIKITRNQRATFIVGLTITAQQLSGIVALYSYSGLIFEKTADSIDPNLAVGLTGLVTLVFNIVAFFFVEKTGRKPLLLISAGGCVVCLICLAAYFHAQFNGVNVDSVYWLPMVSVMVFYAFHASGLGPIPYTILSEIFSTNVKAWAVTVVSIYGALLSVAVSKLYQVISDAWGEHVIFYSYAVIETFLGIIIAIFVFETKGKSFEEIQARLKRNRITTRILGINKFQSYAIDNCSHM